MSPASKPYSILAFALYALGVSALEFCAYMYKGPFSIVASRVWLLGGAVYLICSLMRIGSTFGRDIRERFAWGIIATLTVAAVLFWRIQLLDYDLNGEGTHQITIGLRAWTQPDLAYTACGHFCYPMRQYLLAALPTKLFGRHPVSVRLGYLWINFLGMLLFYSGLRERLRGSRSGGFLAAMALPSVLTFPYLVMWLRFICQASMPPSLTLAAIGWYLLSLAEVGPITALCLSWIGAMLATTYTPGLAGAALLVSMLLLAAAAKVREGKKREAALLVLATVIIVSFATSSFMTRGDVQLKLYQERRGSFHDIWTQVSGAYETVFFLASGHDGQLFMSLLFLLPLNVYLLTSLWWRNGVAHFVNAVWVIGIVGTSCYLTGYAVSPPAAELSKAMILVPPAIAGIVIAAGDVLERAQLSLRKSAGAVFLILVIYVGWNLKHVHDVLDNRDRRLMQAMEWSLTVASEHGLGDRPVDIYMVSSRTHFGVQDYVEYLFPKAQNLVGDPSHCFEKFTPTRSALILYEDNTCEAQLDGLRSTYPGFQKLPVEYGLNGFVFVPPE